MRSIWQDARYGLRLLRREPGFAFVAVLTIALGVGATTTLFSVAYGVLLKPLPWADPGRLVRVSESRQGRSPRIRGTITNGTYLAWKAEPSTIEAIAGWRLVATTAVIGGGDSTRLQTAAVTPSLFTVLKTRPLRGRVLVEDDGPAGANGASKDVIVLSYGLWQERFGGRDEAVGSVVQVAGKPLTVVGVMPKNFAFPDRDTRAWTPWAVVSVLSEDGGRRVVIFSALARLRQGATVAQAAAEGTRVARSAPDPGLAAVAMFGGNGPADISAVPALDMMTADVKPAVLVLFAAGILLLVTATANVAGLQLARATVRRREIAVRAAIGAGTARLTRQLVIESLLLGLTGGAVGMLLAVALHRVLPSIVPADFPRIDEVAIDIRVMLFAVAAASVASVACGLLPALQARRVNLVESLSDAGGAPVGAGMRSPTARARSWIMTGQLAVSCVLLIGAVLLGRSFIALLHADRGYDASNVLTARLPMPAGFSLDRRTALLETLADRMRTVPGVAQVAFGNALPLLSSGGFRAFKMRPAADPSTEVDVNTIERVVSPGYFAALGLRLTAGRALSDSDTMTSPEVIVVNRSFAARYLGAQPIGAIVPNLGMCRGDNDRWEVVGVVADMRQGAVSDPVQPELFLPYRQVGCPAAMPDPIMVIRTSRDPLPYTAALRAFVREEAPSLALDSVMTMEDRVLTSLSRPRTYAVLLGAFALFAVLIAGVGLFGLLSYSVAQRSREIGVRTALGAQARDIVALVLRQALSIAATGLAVGLALAFAAMRVWSTLLYDVSTYDAWSFAIVPLVLGLVTAVACVLPARRAARVDPLTALRSM
jgi:putative ABC transport system permease protein